MNGELHLSIQLVGYGNAYLMAGSSACDVFLNDPSGFQYISEITFSGASAPSPAASVLKWFEDLKVQGVRKLTLYNTPHRTDGLPAPSAEAFANANPRLICSEIDGDPVYWAPIWKHRRGSWVVEYIPHCNGVQNAITNCDVNDAITYLRGAVERAKRFAIATSMENWQNYFEKALIALDSEPGSRCALPNTGYTTEARRLISGATASWVFGGMGSWNDVWFSDKSQATEYEAATDELYSGVIGGILTATNSFEPSPQSIT